MIQPPTSRRDTSKFNPESIPEWLAPGGVFADLVPAYEDRPYQRELALEVGRLLEAGGRLAVEAPTGIGKSLGYALPAALWSLAGHGPVVVATHTKALQDQLLRHEAPRLARAVGEMLRVELLKGRSNYLCRRRFEAAAAEATGEGTRELLARLRPWVESTRSGDFAEVSGLTAPERGYLQARLAGDVHFCAQARCTPAEGCFFKRARARAGGANLLVVNHALLSIHLFGGQDLLPAFDALVVDEAHAFVRVALDQLTVRVGPARVAALTEAVPGRHGVPEGLRRGEGASRLAAVQGAVTRLETEARAYFGTRVARRGTEEDRRRYRDPGELAALVPRPPDGLVDALATLGVEARILLAQQNGDDPRDPDRTAVFLAEAERFADLVESARVDLEDLLAPDPEASDRVCWREGEDAGFSLNSAPLELGPRLGPALDSGPGTVVFTSATLAAGEDFGYFAREIGQDESLPSVAYPSPFDFAEQALFLAVRQSPDPREPEWAPATAQTLDALMADPGRKTMALFTSFRDVARVAEQLRGGQRDLAPPGYELFVQEPGGEPSSLLDAFRSAPRALLLGTATFWEGVDLPGEALEVLVLTRLPFGVPTEPRFAARAERLESSGENAFTQLYLPEAVLRLKQGFGRLIRRRSDRGIVAVLDPRLVGKGYGRRFASALPLPVTEVADGPALAQRAATWWNGGGDSPQGDLS